MGTRPEIAVTAPQPTPDSRVEVFARAVWDTTRVVDRPYDALGGDPVTQFADEDGANVLARVEADGLLVLDPDDEATVERVANGIRLAAQAGLIQSDSLARAILAALRGSQ